MKPLDGRTILITRARHQAESLAVALEQQGAKVPAIPAIEMVPPDSYAALDQALADMRKYRWLILTSANGVTVLAERMRRLQKQADTLRHAKVVAIGPATARALEAHGFPVDVMPPEYVAESLIETLRDRVAGQNVLLVRAKVARDVIPVALRKAGAVVDVADAYQTVIPASSCAAVQQLLAAPSGLPDAVTFTSSSTVTNFFLLMKEAGVSVWPPSMAAASIGPITSRTLRDHGLEPDMEATEFTIAGLVAAICRWAAASAK